MKHDRMWNLLFLCNQYIIIASRVFIKFSSRSLFSRSSRSHHTRHSEMRISRRERDKSPRCSATGHERNCGSRPDNSSSCSQYMRPSDITTTHPPSAHISSHIKTDGALEVDACFWKIPIRRVSSRLLHPSRTPISQRRKVEACARARSVSKYRASFKSCGDWS